MHFEFLLGDVAYRAIYCAARQTTGIETWKMGQG